VARPAAVLIVCTIVLSVVVPAVARAERFTGYVAGVVSGKGHSFIVGNGLNLVFIDRARARTKYKVCWQKRSGAASRCWRGKTGEAGARDVIFTGAPSQVGNFVVRWFIHGNIKAHWEFHNGQGD
jgi:hypothetical protein